MFGEKKIKKKLKITDRLNLITNSNIIFADRAYSFGEVKYNSIYILSKNIKINTIKILDS